MAEFMNSTQNYNQNNNRGGDEGFSFEIVEHIAVLSTNKNGWTKEVNIVAWNGGMPKVDIREWNPEHDRMSRGITLTEQEAAEFTKAFIHRRMEKEKQKTAYER